MRLQAGAQRSQTIMASFASLTSEYNASEFGVRSGCRLPDMSNRRIQWTITTGLLERYAAVTFDYVFVCHTGGQSTGREQLFDVASQDAFKSTVLPLMGLAASQIA